MTLTATTIADLAFNALPSGLKGTAIFTRKVNATYNPATGAQTFTTTTSPKATIVVFGARGTMSESFAERVALQEKYLVLTVQASTCGSYEPKQGDTVVVTGVSGTFRVYGVKPTKPDGVNAGTYQVTIEL